MLELCKEIAKTDPNIKIEYIVGEELVERGLNLIYDVGKAGPKPSSLVILKYEGFSLKIRRFINFIRKPNQCRRSYRISR